MTPRERLLAAQVHEEPDRDPRGLGESAGAMLDAARAFGRCLE